MPTTCEIEFENNPHKIVYAGQCLRGTVRLTLTDEKSARGVYIRINGKAYCHWSRGKNNTYTGREDYLNEITYFIGGRDDDIQLAPGVYNYNFQCNLPSQLPTTVEGKFGSISYSARVVVDIPMWPDKEFEQPFTVIRPLDINADPAFQMPAGVVQSHNFLLGGILCCCLSSPVEISVHTPLSGYTPSEVINLEIRVNNRSQHAINEFNVELKKKIEYFAKPDGLGLFSSGQSRTESRFIARENAHGCSAYSNEIVHVNFTVPSVPPTDFTTSSVVKVTYFLRISASVNGCHKNPVIKMPITIGTHSVPFSVQDIVPDLNSRYTQPPTYEEATSSTKGLVPYHNISK